MSAPGQAPLQAFAHRHAPRCPLAAPVRVKVQRAGKAHSMIGRAVNLGEGGIAICSADEVGVSDSVAVEFLLPDLGLGLEVSAVVRYRLPSHSGLEFSNLTRYQQAVIREWIRQRHSKPDLERRSRPSPRLAVAQLRRPIWSIIVALALTGVIAWWHWERARTKIEDQTHQPTAQVAPSGTTVGAPSPDLGRT